VSASDTLALAPGSLILIVKETNRDVGSVAPSWASPATRCHCKCVVFWDATEGRCCGHGSPAHAAIAPERVTQGRRGMSGPVMGLSPPSAVHKGIKRIRRDRAEHAGSDYFSCECFCEDATHGRGSVFARFADTPQWCSCWMCSNAAWGPWEDSHFVPDLDTEDVDENGDRGIFSSVWTGAN
jgi:hypothetical protein